MGQILEFSVTSAGPNTRMFSANRVLRWHLTSNNQKTKPKPLLSFWLVSRKWLLWWLCIIYYCTSLYLLVPYVLKQRNHLCCSACSKATQPMFAVYINTETWCLADSIWPVVRWCHCAVIVIIAFLPSQGYIIGDRSFPRQIFPNTDGQFAKFRGSPCQIFHIQ